MSDREPTTTTSTTSSTPPQPVEENVRTGYSSPQEMVARREFEREMKFIKDHIGDTNYIMGVVVIVLAVGFITLLVTVIGIVIQSWGFNANIQSEMIKATEKQTQAVQQFNKDVEKMNAMLTPTPLPEKNP